MRRCVVYIYDPDTTLNFDLKVKFIGFLTCFCVQPITFLDWHWLTIFGTWVNTIRPYVFCTFLILIWCWPLTSRSNYRLLSCLHIRPLTSVSFDIGIPYLAHRCITMRGCVKYIHNPDTILELWPQGQIYRVYDMALCSGPSFFVLWHSHTLFGNCECITMVRCVYLRLLVIFSSTYVCNFILLRVWNLVIFPMLLV